MGDFEPAALAVGESTLEYHPHRTRVLTVSRESGSGTVSDGQFGWGGCLLKGNGGAQRYPQMDWKPIVECKGIRVLDCETNKSNRDESRA